MHNEKGVNMPFNIKRADNQAAQLRNPGVIPATNNRMVPSAPPVSAAPSGLSAAPPLRSAGPMPPSNISQATPVSAPVAPNAGMAPGDARPPIATQGAPMNPNQVAAIGTNMRRNDPAGLPAAGLRGPRNPRIV